MREPIQKRAQQAIDQRVFPGCTIGILKNDRFDVLPIGTLSYGDERVSADTVYDLASITKSIPVATLALELIGEHRLELRDPVLRFIPELFNDHGATIEDLLRYRVKGPRLSTLPFTTFEEVRTFLFERGFDGPPGESHYTNLPAYMLGVVLERVSGESIGALAHRRIFEPREMRHATFFPSPDDCAPTEIDDRGEVRGLPHDESAYLFAQARRTAGHAGLFSTAGDLLRFASAMLGGVYPHALLGAAEGLGWQTHEPHWMGVHADGAFGKTGFTGTSILIDPVQKRALVILSNRTYPHRPEDAASKESAINVVRRDIADLVFA